MKKVHRTHNETMPKQPPLNPIVVAVTNWVNSIPSPLLATKQEAWHHELISTAPKRFTVYEPMALLPAGSFTSPTWTTLLQALDPETASSLWSQILAGLSKRGGLKLTHLAITEGIPLRKDGEDGENILRSPSGLRILHGDFGSSNVHSDSQPSSEEFERTLWVSTKQNGIFQTWAPKWTMFSRGNVKEKARLLEFPGGKGRWAVDLYAGIGYFVFCYAKLGMRVLCWEINPWSVEGLRRGALTNKWTVRVVQGSALALPLEDIMAGGEQIIVFLESNERALDRLHNLQSSQGLAKDIAHVNCGFLPTSEPTWNVAWDVSKHSEDACLHLHENVGVDDIPARQQALQIDFDKWASNEGQGRVPAVSHVEKVKTFAPGVWHCVFDTYITKSTA